MTALRTFGKLLLRRLPQDDTLNRELARDIILQVFPVLSFFVFRALPLARPPAHSQQSVL